MRKILTVMLPLALAAPAGAATPAELAQAKAYVEGIYRAIPGPFDYASVRYAPELKSLIDRDRAYSKATGDIGVSDGVPFCDCQDTAANYRIMSSGVAAHGAAGAIVTVMLRNEKIRRFSVDLILSKGRWLVADVHSPDTPSFLDLLRREVPGEEAELRRSKGRR